jgi:hypothetical protein
MTLHIEPLRNMVVVELELTSRPAVGGLTVIRDTPLIRLARVTGCGPEVRDILPGQRVLVNTAVATQLNGSLLVPEPTILGTA